MHLTQGMGKQPMTARLILAVFATLAAASLCSRTLAQQTQPPLPDFDGFIAEVKSRLQLDQRILNQYTYQQRSAQTHFDKLGRVKKTETQLYEVFPHVDTGLTYRRLIEKNGAPVSENRLKKQDRDYEKRRAAREKKRLKFGPRTEHKAKQEEQEAIDEAFRAFEIAMEGRETIHGRPAIRFSFQPKPGFKVKTSDVKVLHNFAGRVWFDETLYELARLEVEAIKDVGLGFGLVAKLNKGARGVFERRFFNEEVWLPSTAQFSGNLRLLLFKNMRMQVVDEFFDYRKFSVEASVTYGRP
jgi:hypothetical protein